MFANEVTDKELISKIYKLLLQLNKNNNNNNKNKQKMDRRSKQTFLERRHTDGKKKHMKRWSTLLIIREM